jgi:mRNA interferase RelE/StbE
MARFELRFKPSVAKDLRGVPVADVRRILERIEALRDTPRPDGSERRAGQTLWRIRQGRYRIVYLIDDLHIVVEVIRIGHRREIYRL